MADHGTFHWNELLTGEVEKSKAFFAEVCGWTYDDVPMPNFTYTVARSGGGDGRRHHGQGEDRRAGYAEPLDGLYRRR